MTKRIHTFESNYDIVVIDPPWPYYGQTHKDGAAAKHYDLMTAEDINALPVKSLFRGKNGACFVWATTPKLDLAIEAIKAWGLHYRGVAFVWVKTRGDGEIIGAQGVPPTATKSKVELLLLATVKPRGRPFKLLTSKANQLIQAPRSKHSEKPLSTYDAVVELYGDLPRVEIFSRRIIPGWDRFGNEAPETIDNTQIT
jgi:N6-adenosine-specific RNA methylase IME4